MLSEYITFNSCSAHTHSFALAQTDCMEAKGLKVNSNKTKIFISGPNINTQTQVRLPVVVGEGVSSNFVLSTSCSQWIHKKCNWLIGKFETKRDYQCDISWYHLPS